MPPPQLLATLGGSGAASAGPRVAEARGERVRRVPLERQHQRLRTSSGPSHARQRRAPLGDGAGLVEHQTGPGAPSASSASPPLMRMPARAARPMRHRHRERRGERQRARTGDDQQRDRVVERAQPGRARSHTANVTTASTSTTATNHAGEAVGELHHRRAPQRARLHLAAGCGRAGCASPASLDAHRQRAAAVHRAGEHAAPGHDAPGATRR